MEPRIGDTDHWTFSGNLTKKPITLKLKPLNKRDRIAVIAPSGPFDRPHFLHGIRELRKAGFLVSYQKNIFSRQGYLAGSDQRRAKELNHSLSDDCSAVLVARGGFGCQRLLPFIKPVKKPRIVMGSSDITVLLIHLWKRHRLPSLYGPMIGPHLGDKSNVQRVISALTEPDFLKQQKIVAKKSIGRGRAQGRLVGGCLTLITSTLGTPWEIDTDGTILFLEDVNEEPYAVDRMLTQLEQAGKFRKVRGLVFGTFRQGETLFPQKIESVIREKFSKFSGPILWGTHFGHCSNPLILPFGGDGKIEGKRLIITKGIFS